MFRFLSHPLVALPAWALSLYVWHLPPLYEGAVAHPAVHGLEHASFLFFSVNLWMALLGPLPKPAWFGNLGRLGYIVAARLTGAVLGNVFLWANHPFYDDTYPRLGDQSLAGSVMMVEESILTIGLFCWLFLRAARQTEERDRLVELGADPDRATRAVAAGRGDALRARLEAGGNPVARSRSASSSWAASASSSGSEPIGPTNWTPRGKPSPGRREPQWRAARCGWPCPGTGRT